MPNKNKLTSFINFLSGNIKYLFLFYILAQCALLFRFPVQYISDSGYYWKLAQDCISSHGFYPLPQHIYKDFIVAPLYINVIVLLLNIYNSTLTIGIFNIILNSLQLFLLYKITSRVLNKNAAVITALFYILYLNNAGLVLVNLTELFYTTLILLSVYFFLNQGKYNLLLAGLFCGASIAVRPLGWALFIAYLFAIIIKHSDGMRLRNLSFITVGLAAFIIILGSLLKTSSGYFIYSSSTGPINILMSANDKANGGFYPNITEKGEPGYIPGGEKLNYLQKQDTLQSRAISWIKAHPMKWISFIPNKIVLLLKGDDIAVSRLVSPDFNYQKFLKIIKHDPSVAGNYSIGFLFGWLILWLYQNLFYFASLIFLIFGFRKLSKNCLKNPHLKMFLIYAALGIIITLVANADVRYKYPFMFIVFICNSFFITGLLEDSPSRNL